MGERISSSVSRPASISLPCPSRRELVVSSFCTSLELSLERGRTFHPEDGNIGVIEPEVLWKLTERGEPPGSTCGK